MRFSIAATVAALSATALAQAGLPDCAKSCFGNNLGNCGIADVACICGNEANINKVSCCVFASCSQTDIQTTIGFAVALCKNAGVNVNTSPSCPSGSAAASGSASSKSASESASAASAASASASASVSGASRVSGTVSVSRTASASGSAVSATGAAPVPTGAGYGLGMVLAGMLAAL